MKWTTARSVPALLTAASAGQAESQTERDIQQRLAHWQRDPDLASVRDRATLDTLPKAERMAWHLLWDDVEALLRRVQEKPK